LEAVIQLKEVIGVVFHSKMGYDGKVFMSGQASPSVFEGKGKGKGNGATGRLTREGNLFCHRKSFSKTSLISLGQSYLSVGGD
jgi:hypothetical protein